MVWQFVRLAALAAWLFLVAKWLGPGNYGQFMGVAGLATTIAGLAGLGIGLLMYQSVSVDAKQFSTRWRQTLLAYVASAGLLFVVFLPIAVTMFDGVESSIILALGVSEVLAFPFVGAAAFAFAAHERMGWAAALPAAAAVLRAAVAAFYFVIFTEPTIEGYVIAHAATSVLSSALSILSVNVLLKPSPARTSIDRHDVRQGLGYSGVWFTGNALTSWDKALALRIGGSELAGLYAISYRIAAVLAVPVDSLVMVVMPRLFRQGSGELHHPKLVLWLCVAIGAYGSLIGVGLILLADYIPTLLGVDFAAATHALRWLGPFVLLYGFRQLSAQILVAQNQKRLRLMAEVVALASMTVLSLWLIPKMGLLGAVVSMLLVEGGLAVVMWTMAIRCMRNRSVSR
jgi:O-antigen/teichoic acid export membrane protein